MTLKGKNILITGSTKGIGLAIAKEVAGLGAVVIVTGRSSISITNSKSMKFYKVDFSEYDDILELKQKLENDGIKIDVLVNNVGTSVVKDFSEMTIEDFDTINNLNYRSVFAVTNVFLKDLIETKGSIINILSVAVRENFAGNSLYSGSKSAVSSMMNVLREELRDKEVDIVNVLPGATSTELWPIELRKEFESKMMSPEDVSSSVVSILESIQSQNMTIEEILLRPKSGNI